MKKIPVMLGLALLIAAPAAFAVSLLWKISSYDKLLEKHECDQPICEADFDGDGVNGTLSIDRTAPKPPFDSWFVARDSGNELLRLPRRSFDNSLRTHAALVYDKGTTRLIIYDHIHDGAGPRSLVLAFDGHKMQQVSPTEKDYQILAAIGAHDETGTLGAWSRFRLLVWPILLCYYLTLYLVIWGMARTKN